MKFPTSNRICSELLSDYYQRIEDVWKLTSKHYSKIDYYIKSNSVEEWLSGKVKYDTLGRIISEESFNQEGELVNLVQYEFSENIVIRVAEEEKSTWKFDKNKLLYEEIHEYDFDGPDYYKFTLNDRNQLSKINDEIQLNWEENEPIEVVKLSNSTVIKSIANKTILEIKILNNETGDVIIFRYDKYGRLIEKNSGNRITKFKHFGYDMMTGSEVETIFDGQITYKAYREERLIADKVIESVTKFFDDGINLSRTVREVKTMK